MFTPDEIEFIMNSLEITSSAAITSTNSFNNPVTNTALPLIEKLKEILYVSDTEKYIINT